MTSSRPSARLNLWIAVIASALIAGLVVLAFVSPVGAWRQNSISSDVTYTVDIANQRVLVNHTFTVPAGLESFEVFVPGEATDFSVGAPFERTKIDQVWDALVVSSNQSPQIEMSYTLTENAVRSDRGVLVNESVVRFAMWPASATSVRVWLPQDYVLRQGQELFDADDSEAGLVEYRAKFPNDLADYSFIALRGKAFDSRIIEVEGTSIRLDGWVDDQEWMEHTTRYVSEGVPVLSDLIGVPWPDMGLEIVESVRPNDAGYSAWYVHTNNKAVIELSDSLNESTLLHELSHSWFNQSSYLDRWMVEGLAEEYASQALYELDGVITEPMNPGPAPASWNGLLEWQDTRGVIDRQAEWYGYSAAWFVMDELADEVGSDGMRSVLVAMNSSTPAYGFESDPQLRTVNDWRRLLDLMEEVGGAKQADAVYRQWVIPSELQFVLDTRAATRTEMHKFADGDLANVPLGIRRAMARWEFDEASAQLKMAADLNSRIQVLEQRSFELGLEMPISVRQTFTSSTSDFNAIKQLLEETEAQVSWFEQGKGTEEQKLEFSRGTLGPESLADNSVPIGFDRQLNAERTTDGGVIIRWLITLGGLAFVGASTVALRLRLVRPPGVDPVPQVDLPQVDLVE